MIHPTRSKVSRPQFPRPAPPRSRLHSLYTKVTRRIGPIPHREAAGPRGAAYLGGIGVHDRAEGNVPNWPVYIAVGDSLTAGRADHGPDGGRIGWARRLAGLL